MTDTSTIAPGAAMRARVSAALGAIAANAERAERERRVPDENIEALRDAGFFKSLQPAAYGGTPMGADEYTPAVVDIAGACASTAWAAGLLAQHSHLLALMSAELQDEVWGDDPDALASSSVAAINSCEEVSGGVSLSGRMGMVQRLRSRHLGDPRLQACGARTGRDGDPALRGRPPPRLRDPRRLVHRRAARHRLEDARARRRVRARAPHRIDLRPLTGGTRGFGVHGGIFHAPFTPWFSLGFSAVSLGISLRFIELYPEKVKTRTRAYTGAAEVNSAAPAMRLAESYHQLTARRATLEPTGRR